MNKHIKRKSKVWSMQRGSEKKITKARLCLRQDSQCLDQTSTHPPSKQSAGTFTRALRAWFRLYHAGLALHSSQLIPAVWILNWESWSCSMILRSHLYLCCSGGNRHRRYRPRSQFHRSTSEFELWFHPSLIGSTQWTMVGILACLSTFREWILLFCLGLVHEE